MYCTGNIHNLRLHNFRYTLQEAGMKKKQLDHNIQTWYKKQKKQTVLYLMQENGLDIPSKTISKNLLSYEKRYVHHSCTSRIKICRIYLLWPFYLTREKIYAHHSSTSIRYMKIYLLWPFLSYMKEEYVHHLSTSRRYIKKKIFTLTKWLHISRPFTHIGDN